MPEPGQATGNIENRKPISKELAPVPRVFLEEIPGKILELLDNRMGLEKLLSAQGVDQENDYAYARLNIALDAGEPIHLDPIELTVSPKHFKQSLTGAITAAMKLKNLSERPYTITELSVKFDIASKDGEARPGGGQWNLIPR